MGKAQATDKSYLKTRLTAVQWTLLLLLVCSLTCALVTRPHPENGRFMAALDEMSLFRKGFKREALEKSLLGYARAQGTQPLQALVGAIRGKRVPSVQLAKDAPPLQPLAAVELRTLEQVRERSQPQNTLAIGVAHPADLGASIAWRLARMQDQGTWTLTKVELAPAQVSQADLDLDAEVARLRIDAMNAQTAVDSATKKVESAEQLYATRVKWRLPWKVLSKTDEARKEAHATLDSHQQVLTDTVARYEDAAKRALAPRSTTTEVGPKPFALAIATFDHAGNTTQLQVPAAIELRSTSVPRLSGGDFPAAHKAELWDELKGLSPDQAVEAIRRHFNWHYHYVEVLGIRLGGMTLLQFLPCILPLLVFIVIARMRAVSESYNPFGTTIDSALPRVGFGARALDAVVLVVLPVAAAANAAVALLFIGQVPALPVISAVLCLVLGIYAFGKLGDLQGLVEAVVRSHSNPPPHEQREPSPP